MSKKYRSCMVWLRSDVVQMQMAKLMITRRDLAKRSGMCYGSLCDAIRNGVASPKTCGKIAEGLGVSVREIMEIPSDEQGGE